jgi:hypothetical protein
MMTNQPDNEIHKSTYALLVQSEDKKRSLLETIAYGLFILSAVAAIWQFALQPVNFPVSASPTASVTQAGLASRS